MGHKGYLGAPRQRTNGCSVTRVTRGDYIGDRRMRGREKELEVALGMLRAAEAGRGGILLVEGEPGIGKSRFLEESAAAATARGFTLAWGQADARRMPGTRVLVPTPEELLTPAGAADCGRPWWDAPAAGPDGGLALHTAESPLRTAYSPLRTADSPMLIVLDDLECADRAMLWGLRGLAQQPRTRPPLWLLARSTASAYSDAQWLFTHLEHSGAARLRLRHPDTRAPGHPAWRPASFRSGSWPSSSDGPPRSAPGPGRSWRSAPCWAARSASRRWPRSSVRHPHGCCRTSRPRCGPTCSWRHRTRSYSTGSWCGGHSLRACPGRPPRRCTGRSARCRWTGVAGCRGPPTPGSARAGRPRLPRWPSWTAQPGLSWPLPRRLPLTWPSRRSGCRSRPARTGLRGSSPPWRPWLWPGGWPKPGNARGPLSPDRCRHRGRWR